MRGVGRNAASGVGKTSDGSGREQNRPGVTSSRASQFQSRNKCKRVIRLVDVYGQVSRVGAGRRQNTTSHRSVLNSLSHRGLALPHSSTFGPDGNHAWPLDETGMITTDEIRCIGNNLCYNKVERNEVTEINKLDAPKELLSLHRLAP
jgi:hypothetical protein